MNEDILKGKWAQLKGKAKEQWGKLTDDDLTKINGQAEQLSGFLQKTYGYNEDKTKEEINKFLEKHKLG